MLIAVATLAVGIGASTAIFSAVQGVLLRPLPYQDPERLVVIWNDLGNGAQSLPAVSPLDYLDYQQRSRTFEQLAAASGAIVVGATGILGGAEAPERADISAVSANFFPLLGVAPARGRHFLPAEEAPNGPKVALISHELWTRRYGADPELVDGTIDMDGIAYTAVGVLPRGFRLLLPAEVFMVKHSDVWIPLQFDYERAPPRNFTFWTVFGRLAPGATLGQARAEMDSLAERLRQEHPVHQASDLRIRVVPLHQDVVKQVRPTLLLLQLAVTLLLLIACVNVAHLLLVRAAARQQELAVRAALGAGRWSIARMLLAESVLLGCGGAVAGLGLAGLALSILGKRLPTDLPRVEGLAIDGPVVLFAIAAGTLTAVLFGLLPAFGGSRLDLAATLKEGGRSRTASRSRLRGLLVTAEVALALLLLVGAGLLARSASALQRVDPGFDPGRAVTFKLTLPLGSYPGGADRLAFFLELEERLRALPGVGSVGSIFQLPLTGSGQQRPYAYDESSARDWESVTADERHVTDDYFDAVGATLLAGRGFDPRDGEGPETIVVDESLAKRAFPDGNAVGRDLQIYPTDSPNPNARIIGVVEHQRLNDLSRDGREQIYRSYRRVPGTQLGVVVRPQDRAEPILQPLQHTVAAMDPALAIEDLRPLSAYVDDATAPARFSLTLMTLFGLAALLLAAVGVYGVLSHTVGQRTVEIGIRAALGSDRRSIFAWVLSRALGPVLAGTAVGAVAAFFLSRSLSHLLYAVHPADPVVYLAAAASLLVVALGACWVPAYRATRIDPAAALSGS